MDSFTFCSSFYSLDTYFLLNVNFHQVVYLQECFDNIILKLYYTQQSYFSSHYLFFLTGIGASFEDIGEQFCNGEKLIRCYGNWVSIVSYLINYHKFSLSVVLLKVQTSGSREQRYTDNLHNQLMNSVLIPDWLISSLDDRQETLAASLFVDPLNSIVAFLRILSCFILNLNLLERFRVHCRPSTVSRACSQITQTLIVRLAHHSHSNLLQTTFYNTVMMTSNGPRWTQQQWQPKKFLPVFMSSLW